jgi:hypothetical protein
MPLHPARQHIIQPFETYLADNSGAVVAVLNLRDQVRSRPLEHEQLQFELLDSGRVHRIDECQFEATHTAPHGRDSLDINRRVVRDELRATDVARQHLPCEPLARSNRENLELLGHGLWALASSGGCPHEGLGLE